MAKHPTYPNRAGIDAALDLVEETLAKLKEREEQSRQLQPKNTETNTVAVQTSTINLFQEETTESQKETSVLISRRSSKFSNSFKGHQQHRSGTGKTKIKKNKCIINEKPGPKYSIKISHISQSSETDRNNNPDIGTYRYDTQHSIKCRHRKQNSSSDNSNQILGSRNIKDIRSRSKNSAGEFLRGQDYSRDEMLDNGQTRLWIPPLSQSSPRELASRSNFKDSQHNLNFFPETSIPSSSRSRVGLTRENSKIPQPPKATIPLSGQSYADPTLCSKLRVKLSERKEKDEKENLIPFIPSGSENRSHHVGVIMQQKLGLLKNIPSKKLESLTGLYQQAEVNDGTDSESSIPVEVIKTAMNNLQEHIAQVAKQSAKQ